MRMAIFINFPEGLEAEEEQILAYMITTGDTVQVTKENDMPFRPENSLFLNLCGSGKEQRHILE